MFPDRRLNMADELTSCREAVRPQTRCTSRAGGVVSRRCPDASVVSCSRLRCPSMISEVSSEGGIVQVLVADVAGSVGSSAAGQLLAGGAGAAGRTRPQHLMTAHAPAAGRRPYRA